jgi:SAM-dependent methyltransferase
MGTFIHQLYRALPKPPSTNLPTGQFAYDVYKMLPDGARVLDVGAKDSRGKKRASKTVSYIATDIAFSHGLDVVADAHALPFKDASIDAALCVSVLMHTRQPFGVVEEMFRVLKPGGLIYINAPFVYRTALDPVDYYRFSADGLAQVCSAFEPIQTGFNRGPASTMADLLPHFLAILFSFNSNALRSILLDMFQWGLFWIKYLDILLKRYSSASIIHSGAFFFGRKPARRPESNPAAHAGVLASAR